MHYSNEKWLFLYVNNDISPDISWTLEWCRALQFQCVFSHLRNRIIFSCTCFGQALSRRTHSAPHNEPVLLQQLSMSRMTGSARLYSCASLPPSSAGVAHTWRAHFKVPRPVIWHTPEQWGFHGGNSHGIHINSGIISVWSLIKAHVTQNQF